MRGARAQPAARLARPATRFIGRARDLDALDAAFASARLVTITGPGGVGKTRLATEHGLRRGSSVWFCDLSSARDVDDICLAVAQGLAVALAGGAGPVRQLAHVLEQREGGLVILDNFEQVTPHAAATVGVWLASGRGARLLVTSREPLHLRGEALLRLEPLPVGEDPSSQGAGEIGSSASLPGPPAPGESPPRPVGAGAGGEAVELLQDRLGLLGAARPPDAAPALLAIARRLDGIPLALELAAARIAAFGTEAVAARLERGLDVLGRANRDVAARQETMARTISWSWELLEPWEQDALTQCALFRGGFTLEAAEAVIDLRGHPGAPAVLAVVEALRDKSLLRVAPSSPRGPEGVPRFDLYEVVRAFVQERAPSGPPGASARHSAHFLRLGEALASGLDGPRGAAALGELARERDNLAAVLERGLAAEGEASTALRAASILSRFHAIRGPLGLQVRRLDLALQHAAAGAAPAELRARALLARGNAKRLTGRVAEGRADLEEALAIARAAGDPRLEGEALSDVGAAAIQEARFDDAIRSASAAVDRLRTVGDAAPLAGALRIVANAQHHQGRVDLAIAAYEEARALYRAAAHRRGEATVMAALAGAYIEVGRRDDAIEIAERGVAIHHELGDRWEAHGRLALGIAHADARDWPRARQSLEEGMRVGNQVGDPYVVAVCLGYTGILDCVCGEPERGAAVLAESLEVVSWGVVASLFRGLLGGALASLGRVDRAQELFDQAERELEAAASPLLLEAVHLQRGLLELALARQVEAASDGARASALRKAARARRAAVTAPPAAGRAVADSSAEVRLSLAILERALGSPQDGESASAAPALVVESVGRWFLTPDGRRVDCRRRALHGRLLVALAQHRLRHPGDPLRAEALLQAGWPDERILRDAARNRLYVALSRLRGLGLQDVLRSEGDGYLIDPSVPVRFVTGG